MLTVPVGGHRLGLVRARHEPLEIEQLVPQRALARGERRPGRGRDGRLRRVEDAMCTALHQAGQVRQASLRDQRFDDVEGAAVQSEDHHTRARSVPRMGHTWCGLDGLRPRLWPREMSPGVLPQRHVGGPAPQAVKAKFGQDARAEDEPQPLRRKLAVVLAKVAQFAAK